MEHRRAAELAAGLDEVRAAPADAGTLELIVRRPAPGEREVLEVGDLSTASGLVGDGWLARGSRHTSDGSAELARQLTLMNARAVDLFAGDRARWPLAGDQLYVDLDLSEDNLPAGTRLRIDGSVIEVSAAPHTGCAKFLARFGGDVTRLVASPEGRRLRLRGLNAFVVEGGPIRTGTTVVKLGPATSQPEPEADGAIA